MNRFFGAMAAISVAATLAACGGNNDSDEGRSLKVGYAFGFDVGDTGDLVAFDRLAAATDIELTFVETGGGAEAVAALTRGDIDMAKLSFGDALNAIGQGADIRLVFAMNPKLDDVLVGGPEVQTVAELRGKRILAGIPPPNQESVPLGHILEQAGLEEGDYELKYVPDSQNRSAALESGATDAATLESVDIELASGDVKLNRLADIGAGIPAPSLVLAVRSDFPEENRALVGDVVRELRSGLESLYGPDGRDEWVEQAQEEELADQPEEVAARIYEGHRKLGYWTRGGPITEAQHDATVAYLVGGGIVEKPVPFDQVWDTSFWTAAP
jgi:ABC-type nitrate/sulfonate/bicarbonate transport system substrate-binding protein